MKRKFIALMVVLAAGLTTANAQDLSIFGSYWSPDDGDAVMGGGAGLLLGDLIEVRGTYYEETEVPGIGDLQVIPVDVGLVLSLTSAKSITLSIQGGGSYFIMDDDNDAVDNEWGWFAGGRLEIPLQAGTSLFGDVMWRGADLNDSDVNLSGIAANVGLMF